jgi:hypothetical protein
MEEIQFESKVNKKENETLKEDLLRAEKRA